MTFEEAWQKGIVETTKPEHHNSLIEINKYKKIINCLWEIAYEQGKLDVVKMLNLAHSLKEQGKI